MISWNGLVNCSTSQNTHFLFCLRPWRTAPISEWEDGSLNWTNHLGISKYFCIIQMDCYHVITNFLSVHNLTPFYSNLYHNTSNQNILLFFNGYNYLLSIWYKTSIPSFPNWPLKPNKSVWVFPEFGFLLLSKINYNMPLLGLICHHKNWQDLWILF